MTLKEVIDKSIEVLHPLVENEYDKDLGFPSKLVFFNTVERILKNLYSLKLLTKEISNETEHGICIILRNMLSDFIVNSFVINKSKDFSDSDNLFTSLIYSDFKKVDSYFEYLKDHELITEEEYKNYWKENDSNTIRQFIFKRYDENNLKLFPTNKNIFESLVSNKSTTNQVWKKDIIDAYDIWVLLSKYEHIGWNSYRITRVVDIKNVKLRILKTIKLVLFLSSNIFQYLDNSYNPQEILNICEKINVDYDQL